MITNLKMSRTEAHLKLPLTGPWRDEPDLVTFDLPEAGLRCAIMRLGATGHRNGYVGVPKGHAWYGFSDDDVDDQVQVHGGLTYSGASLWDDSIDRWWVGFDCMHGGDAAPRCPIPHSEYKDWNYVILEVLRLANQATGGEYKLILEDWTLRVARRWTWEAAWEAQQTGGASCLMN